MNPLSYKLTLRFKYYLYLLTFCLVSAISVQAQFSEEDLEKQANDLFESGKYAEAMPLYSQLLSLNPTKPEYNYKYGATALYGDADKKEEAVKFLKFATKKGGVDDKAWYFLGRAYHLNYQFADAVRAYEAYREKASSKDLEELEVERHLESARSGLNLLSKIKDVKVLDKKLTAYESFFRVYDLGEIGGKILVTPDELLSSLDKKNNHKSLIHFRGTGTTVYFSSYGRDGKTGLDIYKAQVLPGGGFSDPVKLGGFVNTDFDEDYPFMHPDGKTFYFSSTGHSSMGGFDIFKCYYDKGMDVFSQPENLDFAVNTPDDELFYIADTAKKMANFASARSSKQGEVHVYKVLVQSNPVELTLVKGSFINRINSSQKLAKIVVIDAATNEKVSEQYTDPNNGDYVVSVPKNGKYKFVVEVQNSDKVHAGMVDIPKSAGVKAYLQEMELVLSAGVEKLLINNRFDETYDGDVLALAKDLLRKQAELDVNFDPDQEPIPEPEPEVEEDFALAYKAAGFPAGMSNEKVLEAATVRETVFQTAIERNRSIKARAVEIYLEKTTEANVKLTEAEDLVEQAKQASGEDKAEMMFSAAILKMEAREILKEAQSAEELAAKIDAGNRDLEQSLLLVSSHADSLKDALESENYEAATALMARESRAQKGELKEFKIKDVEESLLQSSLDAKERSANLMKRSADLREEADELNAKLITRKRQLEKAKGKDAKELEVEVKNLENQLEDLEETIKSSFDRANKSQEIAASEELQYTLFSNFNDTDQNLSPEDQKSLLNTEIGGSDIKAYTDRLANLSIDSDLVSEYAKLNPEAFSNYDPALKRMVASAYLADEPVSTTESEELLAENGTKDPATIIEGQSESDTSTTNESALAQTEIRQDSLMEQNDIEKVGETEISQTNSADEMLALANADSDSSDERLNTKADSNDSVVSQSEPRKLSPEKQIDAEKIKIKAAQDWLLVIDASIADLEQGVGGEDGEDVQAQLEEYRELRQQKLSEIEMSEQLIADLSGDLEEVDGYEQAARNAEKDIEQLSNAQVASLEAKVNMASSDIEFVRDVSKVDPDYIPELTSAELSGLSAPEIAAERIEINKELLVSLDELIRSEGSTDLSENRLRELRSIKLLEIQQDEQVAIGALEYEARTAEAREYRELISETSENTEDESTDLSSLSPKMQEDLQADFNRTMVMGSYERKLASIPTTTSDSSAVSERLKLKKSYLQSLQNEINFYSQTIELQGENAPVELKDRYNELLSDRSRVADEIQEDQNLLAEFPRQESNEALAQSEPEESEINTELPSVSTLSEQFDESYQSQLEEIKSRELTEAEELKALAAIRFQQAERADSLVVAYIDELDKSQSPEEKDEIQLLIQNLDAIAADKRQEADRLMYESDILASTATDASIPEEELNTENELPDTKEPELGSNIQFDELTYKSLNANIAYSKLQNKVDSVSEKKLELQSLVTDYNKATDSSLRKELLKEIERKELQLQVMETSLIRDISQSNAAEIAYYQKANDQMLKSIESEYSEDADLAEYSERASEITEMLSKNESDRSQNNKSESEYLEDELALISSLSDLNADMEDFIASQDQGEEKVTLNTVEGSESPYELLMRNPANHKPEEGKKYLTPIHRQVESALTEERRNEVVASVPALAASADFADDREEDTRKEILSQSTSVDERGYELLKSDPDKLEYVLSAVTADSLKTLENENAVLAKVRSQSANEKYMESARLRNMVVHQNSESEKELVRRRAEKLEREAEMDLEVASIAAKRAEELRVKRIAKEEQLATAAKELSNSELNELNALLRKETYTIIPNVDLGSEEIASAEPVKSVIKTPPKETLPASSESSYSKDEMNLFNSTGNWLDVVEIIGEKDDFSDIEESLFIESEKSAYSEEKPIPIDPVMPDGLIFQVQVGAFRNPIPQDLYKEFAPVMGQRLANGITRYRAGLFRIYKEAKDTRDLIREKGYSDAFVVVYVDGERLTGAQARQILAQAKEMANQEIASNEQPAAEKDAETAQSSEIRAPEATEAPDYYNDPEAAEATQVEITQGLFYTVQVGVYSKPVKLDQLYNLTELNSELTGSGYIRYTSGRYVDVQAAQIRKDMVVQKGVSDAFITAYYNGKRISLDEARKVLAEKGKSVLFNEEGTSTKEQEASEDLIEYIVIMGMMQGDMPEELANSFMENEDWNIQKTTGPGGQEMYVSPKFTSISEAREFLKLAREAGVESAIMGKMVNGAITEVDIEN
jgi:hypothetical protein